jgi:isopentenyl phosphate kinase
METMTGLVFLKLGGSLITDKTRAYTARPYVLDDLAAQVAAVLREDPSIQLVLGHGSGSFGHTAASQHGTRQGVHTLSQWHGFAEVWYQASELNRIVVNSLRRAGLPALTLSPLPAVTAADGDISAWDLAPLRAALAAGLLPVIHGDVVFDTLRGGTILSTEDLFEYLASHLAPQRILLAGLEAAVWADFPARARRLERITPADFEKIQAGLGASHGADVTGGMASKVQQMLILTAKIPGLTALIFSGEEPGNLRQALAGGQPGTLITAG